MTGIETIAIFTTVTVVYNTIVLGINTKTVNKCMEVIDNNVTKY